MSNQLGVIGMGVMGLNLALNAAEKGFKVAIYNRTTSRMEAAVKIAVEQKLKLDGYPTLEGFVKSLETPRKILLLVQAGAAVDATLELLLKLLSSGDIVIDGGNEFYANTERRTKAASASGLRFFGMGVSGGEAGARHGPAMMPGGDRETYKLLAPILEKIAAHSSFGACVDFIGNGGAGNYVKMVHNGIEYGDMQLIAESYSLLKGLLQIKPNSAIAEVFNKWNAGRMSSYLVEVTATVLNTAHPDRPSESLLDDVLDVAGSKGTGKWTVQESCEKGIPCPTIAAALDARNLSAMTETREGHRKAFGKDYESHKENQHKGGSVEQTSVTTEDLETALYLSKLCSYAQGLALIGEASRVHNFEVDMMTVARTWTAGCIIRARLLEDIMNAYKADRKLPHLLLAPSFAKDFTPATVSRWSHVITAAAAHDIPVPAMSASFNYFTMLHQRQLCLNVIQAQRDYFGAHTFKLVSDPKKETKHADWEKGVFTIAP